MHAVIVANGELQPALHLTQIWQQADLRIAADGGARHARLFLERAPDIVIGDLDSLDDETRAWLDHYQAECIRHPRTKDQTDLELALELAQARGATNVTILGAFGGRVDQWIANVLLLTRAPEVKVVDAAGELWVASGYARIEGHSGDTVSLIPLDERVEGMVTEGLEYPLRQEALMRGSTRGISNVMLAERATVHWKKGLLLIVHLWNNPL